MSDITRMIASIDNTGILRSNRFVVTVTFPEMLRLSSTSAGDRQLQFNLTTRISRVDIPEQTIEVAEIISDSRMSLPVARSLAALEPISLSIVLSADAREREYFTKWMGMIHGRDSGFVPMFYDSYKSPALIVDILGEDADIENPNVKYNFYNAYPISVGDVEMAYDDSDAFASCVVSFNYESWSN